MDLIEACRIKDTKEALSLIMNNDTDFGSVDFYGVTALIYACQNKMKEVALELIKT